MDKSLHEAALRALDALIAAELQGDGAAKYPSVRRLCDVAQKLKLAGAEGLTDLAGVDLDGGDFFGGRPPAPFLRANVPQLGMQDHYREIMMVAGPMLDTLRRKYEAQAKVLEAEGVADVAQALRDAMTANDAGRAATLKAILDKKIARLAALERETEDGDALVPAELPRGHPAQLGGEPDADLLREALERGGERARHAAPEGGVAAPAVAPEGRYEIAV